MADHLIAYVRRRLITSWKRTTLKSVANGRPTFVYSSDDSWQFGPYARSGATLWVIASHPPDAPALVARLDNLAQVGADIPASAIPRRIMRHFDHRKRLFRRARRPGLAQRQRRWVADNCGTGAAPPADHRIPPDR